MNATHKITGHNSLHPAFGRDYKFAKDAKAAFIAGVDFTLIPYNARDITCSIRDFAPGASAQLRFKRGMMGYGSTTVVKVTQAMLDALQ